jgi:hypothetical protein
MTPTGIRVFPGAPFASRNAASNETYVWFETMIWEYQAFEYTAGGGVVGPGVKGWKPPFGDEVAGGVTPRPSRTYPLRAERRWEHSSSMMATWGMEETHRPIAQPKMCRMLALDGLSPKLHPPWRSSMNFERKRP